MLIIFTVPIMIRFIDVIRGIERRVSFSWNWQANKLRDQSWVLRKTSYRKGRVVRHVPMIGKGSCDGGSDAERQMSPLPARCLHLAQWGIQKLSSYFRKYIAYWVKSSVILIGATWNYNQFIITLFNLF